MRFPVDIHEFNSVRQRVLLQRSLLEEQGINEKANTKIIGVTLETRPDHINKFELRRLRRFAIFDTCTVFSIFIIEINLLNQAVSRPRDKDFEGRSERLDQPGKGRDQLVRRNRPRKVSALTEGGKYRQAQAFFVFVFVFFL